MTVFVIVAVWVGLGLLLALALGAVIRIADDNQQHCQQEDDTASERVEKYL